MTPTFSVIGVVVADMPTSLAFYRQLGLDIPSDADEQPHVEVSLSGGLRLAFDTQATIRSFDESWTPPTGSAPVALAFDCDTPDAVDAAYRTLVDAGAAAHLEPWDAFWGQRYASVHDPDGNSVELFAALPVSE